MTTTDGTTSTVTHAGLHDFWDSPSHTSRQNVYSPTTSGVNDGLGTDAPGENDLNEPTGCTTDHACFTIGRPHGDSSPTASSCSGERKKRAWLFAQQLVEEERQTETGFDLSVRWTAEQEAQFERL